ncbi:MAG: GTP cyclohydrolase FolE2 [Bdellovibrionota bacterium]
METEKSKSSLPDVAKESGSTNLLHQLDLKWVGMQDIESRILWPANSTDETYFLPARVQIQVSLNKGNCRGIHMSRLFLMVQEKLGAKEFSFQLLREILNESLFTHLEMSDSARMQIDFEIPKMQTSLKSGISSIRNYPVSFEVKNILGQLQESIELKVLYSSTCPASGALSRQLIQNRFQQVFSDKRNLSTEDVEKWLISTDGMIATPHAQRSWAKIKFQPRPEFVSESFAMPLLCENLIKDVEFALGTPVQSAVKRIDEQEFARLNSENMMFCEDAARKLKGYFLDHLQWKLVDGEVHHVESLHPHEAVAFF